MIGMNSHTLPNLVPQFRNGTFFTDSFKNPIEPLRLFMECALLSQKYGQISGGSYAPGKIWNQRMVAPSTRGLRPFLWSRQNELRETSPIPPAPSAARISRRPVRSRKCVFPKGLSNPWSLVFLIRHRGGTMDLYNWLRCQEEGAVDAWLNHLIEQALAVRMPNSPACISAMPNSPRWSEQLMPQLKTNYVGRSIWRFRGTRNLPGYSKES